MPTHSARPMPIHSESSLPTRPPPSRAAVEHANTAPDYLIPKISSDPNPHRVFTHSRIDAVLKGELQNAQLDNIPKLIHHLFPDSTLPAPPQKLLSYIEQSSEHLFKDGVWNVEPFSSDNFATPGQEEGCASFFNAIGALCGLVAGMDLKRVWVSKCNTPLPGIPAVRKPDLTLFDNVSNGTVIKAKSILMSAIKPFKTDKKYDEHQSYTAVRATCQVKSGIHLESDAKEELMQYAYFTFSRQDGRRYVLGVTFCATQIGLSLFDRAGSLHSTSFEINEQPLTFVRLLAGLSFASRTSIGYDPTIQGKGQRRILVENDWYEILGVEFINDVIRGRGTTCYHVAKDGVEYAIKDVWVDTSRLPGEVALLDAARHIKGVPTCVAHATVKVDGREDSTAWPRECIEESTPCYSSLKNIETRSHRRLLISPFASPLVNFKNKIEFLGVLRDAIRGKCPARHKHIYP